MTATSTKPPNSSAQASVAATPPSQQSTDPTAHTPKPSEKQDKKPKPSTPQNKPEKGNIFVNGLCRLGKKLSDAIWHTFCHVIPLYLIIGAIIVIALPSSAKLRWWPFIQDTSTATVQVTSASTPVAPTQSEAPLKDAPTPRLASNISEHGVAQEDVKLTNIAKLAIDATKERVEMMKESYEKIFSFIAAFGALLAFLGFKGIETFSQTKKNAMEAANQAEAAARDAATAKEEAQAAIKELHDFIENQYKIDNSSEINVSHGIILREIASLQKSLTDQNNEECKKRHRDFLRQSLYYLNLATENKSKISPRILSRAYVTKGNVQNMLGDYSKALDAATEALAVNQDDYSAHFNAACYNSKLAEKYNSEGDYSHAATLVNNAIKHLKAATKMNPEYREIMKTETDFNYIKDFPAFKSISG